VTTQIESCACGGMTAVSTKWAKDALLFIQSFRDAHQKCRDVFIEAGTALVREAETDRIDLPETARFIPQKVCPKCGHQTKGVVVCLVREHCGCRNPWHMQP